MKKKLLLLLPIVLLTSCSLMGNDETNDGLSFGTVEGFIPENFDNSYDVTDEISYTSNYEQNYNATLRIKGAYKVNSSSVYTLSSGFVYSKDDEGYKVVTSASQIAYKGLSDSKVELYYNGLFEFTTCDYRRYEGKYLASYPEYDIAVFNIDTPDFIATSVMGDSDKLKIGEDISVLGTPNVDSDLINTYVKGVASGLNRLGSSVYKKYTLYTFPTFQFDAPTNMGMEGGIVMNKNGEVIGITSTKQHADLGFESLSFAVAINDAKPIIDSLIATKTFNRVTLGFTGGSIDFMNKVPWADKINVYSGIYVSNVMDDSLAKASGLKENTIITAITVNDQEKRNINSMEEFQSQIIRLKKNDVLKLHTVNESNVRATHTVTI